MSKEIKNTVEEVMEPVIEAVEVADVGEVLSKAEVPVAVKIVAGVVIGVVTAAVATVFYKKRKDKNELHKPEGEVEVTEEQILEVVDEK